MKVFQSLALSLLSILLFLSLSIFGVAFMLNSTLLSPDFVTSELERLDMTSLTGELITMTTSPSELQGVLVFVLAKIEPHLDEQIGAAIYSVYDYLLGRSQNLDLALTLRNTILSTDFAVSLVNELDLASLAGTYIRAQLAGEIPEEMEFLTEHLDDAIAELEPTIRAELVAAADPVLDYLVGEIQSFNVVISLEAAQENLKEKLRETMLESPPAELASLPQPLLERYFDEFYREFSQQIPSAIEFNQNTVGAELPAAMAEALTATEDVLAEAKPYVGQFQLGYKLLIGLMVLLVLGIVLISRDLIYITRSLGITFLTYGAFEYAGIILAKHFSGTYLPYPEIPHSLEVWLPQFTNNLLAPLEMLSLGLLIGGVVLVVASFVYKRRQSSS